MSPKIASALFLIALPGTLNHLLRHPCMAGHMQHPPYAWWELPVDTLSLAALIVASICLAASPLRFKKLLMPLLLILIVVFAIEWYGFGGLLGILTAAVVLPVLTVYMGVWLWALARKRVPTTTPPLSARR